MIFYLKTLTNRLNGILFLPVKTWKTIKKESGYTVETLIFLFASCLFSGLLSLSKKSSWLSEIYIPFFSVLIASVVMRFFKFINKIEWEKNFNMLVYSFFPLSWCYALSFLINYRLFLFLVGLIYSLILLFISIKILLNITILQSLSLTLKIVLALFSCIYMMMFFFGEGYV